MDQKPKKRRQKRTKTVPLKKIREIKDRLPSGGCKLITEETGLSKGYVSQVLNGTRWNKAVIVKAVEIIRAHEKEMDEITTI